MARSGDAGVELFADIDAEVGEAPHWDMRTETLLFVDLTAGAVHRYDRSGVPLRSFSVGQPVGAAIPRRDGGLVLAVRDGIATVSESGDSFELRVAIERQTPGNRMNDAKCDPAGRLLAGTTAFDFTPRSGVLYRVEPDWSWQPLVSDLTISNGLAWSPEGRHMYFIDSATQGVDIFEYGVDNGSIGNRRRLVTVDAAYGVPDGMTVDAGGGIWVACFGGAAVHHFSPAGEHLGAVRFPVSQVTSCAFGGPDLADLYVTSATFGLSREQLEEEPHAGATFVCRPGVPGLPADTFAG